MNQFIKFAHDLNLVPIPLVGKNPNFNNWPKVTKDESYDIIVDRFINGTNYNNIGIICGKTSGIVVLDIDTQEEGLTTWNKLIAKYTEPKTLKVITGKGGYHYYFKYDDRTEMLIKRSKYLVDGKHVGIDIETNGGQVVFPGSIHPDTKRYYEFASDTAILIADMPDWLLGILLETVNKINMGTPPSTRG